MRRRLTVISLLLVAGAIVNVAVAWGISLASMRTGGGDFIFELPTEHPSRYADAGVVLEKSRGWTSAAVIVAEYGEGWRSVPDLRKELPAWVDPFLTVEALERLRRHPGVMSERFIDAAGWPCFSMSGSIVTQWSGPITNSVVIERDRAIVMPRRSGQWAGFAPMSHVLGFRPIWPGFAINTIFYAAILWMMFAFPFVLRRRRRIKRGLCSACAYPIGTSAVCTECGKSLPIKSVEQT